MERPWHFPPNICPKVWKYIIWSDNQGTKYCLNITFLKSITVNREALYGMRNNYNPSSIFSVIMTLNWKQNLEQYVRIPSVGWIPKSCAEEKALGKSWSKQKRQCDIFTYTLFSDRRVTLSQQSDYKLKLSILFLHHALTALLYFSLQYPNYVTENNMY